MSSHIYAEKLNKQLSKNQVSTYLKPNVVTRSSGNDRYFIASELSDPSFSLFASEAYAADDGYSIRINPSTGEKEMFIAGTRDKEQWALNVLDSALYTGDEELSHIKNMIPGTRHNKKVKFFQKVDVPRQRKQEFYSKIAEENGIDRVYGHSRGGAIVADMDFKGDKVGLDSAMIIASNKDMVNYYEGGSLNPLGLFDEAIGYTGKENVHMDYDPLAAHQVWRSKRQKKDFDKYKYLF